MKIAFKIEQTYEVDIPEADGLGYGEVLDMVSRDCYDLVESGKAKLVQEGFVDCDEIHS